MRRRKKTDKTSDIAKDPPPEGGTLFSKEGKVGT